ncbi:hypothetical protein [Sodalis sp.]|uniref:hypothetical protein n=1 Tax=Sodalis sp. (in: enterobacteria) TaxID=1898979 RepID=UPI003872E31E
MHDVDRERLAFGDDYPFVRHGYIGENGFATTRPGINDFFTQAISINGFINFYIYDVAALI